MENKFSSQFSLAPLSTEVREDIAKRRYDRNARFYDVQDSLFGRLLAEKKREIVAQVRGRVLEIGIGTGKTLPHYPKGIELVGVDISPKMLERAKVRARDFQGNVSLLVGDVQALDFPDNSFDMVVTSCVFCSVTDPVQGFREINRVLRPDGISLHLEHVRSRHAVIGKLMDLLNPMVVRMMGANINRDTGANIRKSGLRLLEEKDLWMDIVKLFKAGKGDFPR
jgi:ubiquinone/menaquinone biosynthesis C-methylase UbiE